MIKKFFQKAKAEDILVLLGMGLRLLFINQHKFWYDEFVSVLHARSPEFSLLLENVAYDNYPPIYFILLRFLMKFSQDPIVLRLSSVVIGTVSLYVFFKIIEIISKRETALIAMIMMAFSPLQIYYSTELRMYILLVLESLVALYAFLKYIKTKENKYLWIYLISAVLALLTQYYACFWLLGISLLVLIYHRNLIKKWILVNLIPLSVFLMWFIYTLKFPKQPCWCTNGTQGILAVFSSFGIGMMGRVSVFDLARQNIGLGFKIIYLLNILFFAFLFLRSFWKHKSRYFAKMQILFWTPLVVMLILVNWVWMFSPRSFILISPLYYYFVAESISFMEKDKKQIMVALSVILLTLVNGLNTLFSS